MKQVLMENLKNKSTDSLKAEYVNLCLGAMVYGADTEIRRHEIWQEIEKRERENTK